MSSIFKAWNLFKLQVLNCQDSVIYILAPLQYAIVYGCCDATIVLGAIGKVCFFIFSFLLSLDLICLTIAS